MWQRVISLITTINVHYGSVAVDKIASRHLSDAAVDARQTPVGSTFVCEMTSWSPSWKCDTTVKRLSIHILPEEESGQFHPSPSHTLLLKSIILTPARQVSTKGRLRRIVEKEMFSINKQLIKHQKQNIWWAARGHQIMSIKNKMC